jgi:hypothetical protein
LGIGVHFSFRAKEEPRGGLFPAAGKEVVDLPISWTSGQDRAVGIISVTLPEPADILSSVRLWTVHPKYLDARGLVALWREALLAQKVLQGKTRGYRHHPQLQRFAATGDPAAALATFLAAVHAEACERGYAFDGAKIGRKKFHGRIKETQGQLRYEWRHLRRKLKRRDPGRLREFSATKLPKAHPMFRIVPGGVRDWEKPF